VSKSNYNDLNQLSFSLKKNNEVVQSASSELMLWKIDELISYVSQFFTLKKGDIIFSGTPSGVGKVEAGDVLEGFIENESFFKVSVK
jgi:2-keto-4-pentenoate hydratase/2-oxohepta-3-ene-1,7-dioic acid hydratase in catechol pathway